MLRRVILFIFLFGFTLNSIPVSSQENTPYIQYFSQDLKAFVIERADGTDRQVFGAGLMPEEDDLVDGPGWSPSGEWFAWSSRQLADEMVMPEHAYIVRPNGSVRVTVIDDSPHVGAMEWSPVEDIIAVTNYADLEYISGPTSTTVYLVDAAQNRIIQSLEAEGVAVPLWSPDGHFMLVATHFYAGRFYTISRTGEVQIFEKTQVDLPAWHPDGRLMLWDVIEDDLLLMDLEIDRTERYDLGTPPPVRESLTPYTEYSPRWTVDTLSYASILSQDERFWLFSTYSDQSGIFQVWLLDFETRKVVFLIETSRGFPFRETNFFLSPAGDLAFFESAAGIFIPIAENITQANWLRYPDVIMYVQDERYWVYDIEARHSARVGGQMQLPITLSPDKRWLVYFAENQYRMFDWQLGYDTLILDGIIAPFDVHVIWLPDSSGFTITTVPDAFSYTITSSILTERPEIQNSVSYSPDSRTEFYYGECNGEIGSCLHDLETDTYVLVPPHPGLEAAGGRVSYEFAQWHPDSEWLLLDQGLTSGGRIPYVTMVRRDGSDARPLTWGCFNPICLQWVE